MNASQRLTDLQDLNADLSKPGQFHVMVGPWVHDRSCAVACLGTWSFKCRDQ